MKHLLVFAKRGRRLAAAAVATLAITVASPSQGKLSGGWLLRLADANRNGQVEKLEWAKFVERVAGGDALDTRAVLAARITAEYDVDADGVWSVEDLQKHFASLDRDKSGSLGTAEVGRAGGALREGSVARVLARFADANTDGKVSAEEWSAFIEKQRAKAKGKDLVELRRLLLEEEPRIDRALAEARPGAFTWKVALLTFESALDIDGNGARDADDLRAAFRRQDRNADGTLSAEELRARAQSVRPVRGPRTRVVAGDAPCMPWQRSLEDALELQKRTGKPLLICVNVDGESACERLARGRYRSEDFAKLAQGFVCLLACPTRHSLRDYDDLGRRIIDPKFGRVTSYEHIAIEPTLYEKYFAGRRVAPRHVGIDRNGKRLFDIFLTGSLAPIDAALRKHGVANAGAKAPKRATLAELLGSPDAAYRDELEERFARGESAERAWIARRCLDASRRVQHPELLRMALRDEKSSVRAAAARAMSAHPSGASIEYFPLAFARCEEARARASLLRGLHVLARNAAAESATRKRATALLRRYAWGAAPALPDVAAAWAARDGTLAPLPTPEELDALGEELGKVERALREKADDPALQLKRAFLNVRYARIRIAQQQNPSLFLDDAKDAAARALALEESARGHALLAWACHLSGEMDRAALAADAALPGIADGLSELAAEALWISIDARIRAVYAAIRDGRGWPDLWPQQVRQRASTLLAHPRARVAQATAIATFWRTIECYAEQHAALRRALLRFPSEGKLHEQLRSTSLYLAGAAGLRADYEKLRAEKRVDASSATLAWYAGFAALTGAERCVRNSDGRSGALCYAKAAMDFERSAELQEEFRSSADWYSCVAQAGLARVEAEIGNFDKAETAIHLACLAGNKARFAAKDGLGRTARSSLDAALRLMRSRIDAERSAELTKSVAEAAARE